MSNPTESFIRTFEEIVTEVNRCAGGVVSVNRLEPPGEVP